MSADEFETEVTDYKRLRFGRYIFRRPLASGGLGVVSICFDEQLNREVALKQIKQSCVKDPIHRKNFCAEAEVTGLLEHPGVVPIYSMGTSDEGNPYYAMRLISGRELRDDIAKFHKSWTKENEPFVGATLRRLIQQLIDVCNVIHYAHSRGVLHRDLKSVNVMLGRYGETLVIDWGLARTVGTSAVVAERDAEGDRQPEDSSSTEQETLVSVSTENTRHSVAGRAMGTVAYAPPEQLNGRTADIDARSDVYSLGAMLFEILTNEPPQKGMSISEALRAIESGEVAAEIQQHRHVPKSLKLIASMALAKRREHRYQSAKELRNDLQGWLDDEPISAHDESIVERVSRWKRRHETFVRMATLFLALIAVTSTYAVYRVNVARNQQQQAKAEATQLFVLARQATDNLLMNTSQRLQQVPDATDVRERLLEDALESYQAMAEVRSDNPELRRELVRVAIGLADVQRQLENREQAIRALQQARYNLEVQSSEDQRLAAQTLLEESRMHGPGNPEDARTAIAAALALTKALTDVPSTPETQLVHAKALIQRAIVEQDLGEPRALDSYESANSRLLQILEYDLDPSVEREVGIQLIRSMSNRSALLEYNGTNDPLIRAGYASALSRAQSLDAKFPDDSQIAMELGYVLNNYADYLVYVANDLDGAVKVYQQAVDAFTKMAADNPNVPHYKENQILALSGLANVVKMQGNDQEGNDLLARAIAVADLLLNQNRNRISFLESAAGAKAEFAISVHKTDPDQAKSMLIEALALLPNELTGETRDYVEVNLTSIYGEETQVSEPVQLSERLDNFVEQTDQMQSSISRFNAASILSEGCQSLSETTDQKSILKYVDIAVERLAAAILENPSLYEAIYDDSGLEFLLANYKERIEAIQP